MTTATTRTGHHGWLAPALGGGEETVSSDMTRQRAEIEGAIAGRTLCDELRRVAETSGDAWAYSDEAGAGGGWQSLTWSPGRRRGSPRWGWRPASGSR